MAGKSNGTGYPLTLRCSKCKVCSYKNEYRERRSRNLEATGQVAPLLSRQTMGPHQWLPFRVRVRCRSCGHEGWTRHPDAALLIRQAGMAVPTGAMVRGGQRFCCLRSDLAPKDTTNG